MNALDFSPDGSLLASGGEFMDGSIRFWDVTLTSKITARPAPNGDFGWWQVRLDDGTEGWVVERVPGIDTLVFAG